MKLLAQAAHLILFTHLPMVDRAMRDQLLKNMGAVSESAYKNEPGVLKYALLVPQDESDQKSLYSIEEYTSQDAFRSHMDSPIVKEMFAWITSTNLYEKTPVVQTLAALGEGFELTKPSLANAQPYVVVTQLPRNASSTAESWKLVLQAAGKDDGTFLYSVYKDADDLSQLVSIQATKDKNGVKSNSNPTLLKVKAGYLYKPVPS